MNLIFFKGRTETADFYTHQLLMAAEKKQVSTYMVDYNNPATFRSDDFYNLLRSGDCTAILFEDIGLAFTDADGNNIWKEHHIPVYSFLLSYPTDSPAYLEEPPADLTLIIPDQSWATSISKHFPHIKGTVFMPGGGTFEPVSAGDTKPLPMNQRDIDILLVEDCEPERGNNYPQFDFLDDKGATFFIDCVSSLISSPDKYAEDVVREYFETDKEDCTAEQLETLILPHASKIAQTAHRFLLQEAVRSLDQAGIAIEVYGKNWESPDYVYSDAIHLHPPVSPSEAGKLMGRAKITLHFMPGYKQGADIRFFDILLNGSVCISTTNEYTERRFKDSTHMVNFDKNNPNQTIADIRYLLSHEDAAVRISSKGTAVAARDTWEQRFNRLMDLIQKKD